MNCNNVIIMLLSILWKLRIMREIKNQRFSGRSCVGGRPEALASLHLHAALLRSSVSGAGGRLSGNTTVSEWVNGLVNGAERSAGNLAARLTCSVQYCFVSLEDYSNIMVLQHSAATQRFWHMVGYVTPYSCRTTFNMFDADLRILTSYFKSLLI